MRLQRWPHPRSRSKARLAEFNPGFLRTGDEGRRRVTQVVPGIADAQVPLDGNGDLVIDGGRDLIGEFADAHLDAAVMEVLRHFNADLPRADSCGADRAPGPRLSRGERIVLLGVFAPAVDLSHGDGPRFAVGRGHLARANVDAECPSKTLGRVKRHASAVGNHTNHAVRQAQFARQTW